MAALVEEKNIYWTARKSEYIQGTWFEKGTEIKVSQLLIDEDDNDRIGFIHNSQLITLKANDFAKKFEEVPLHGKKQN
ncbi:hypothetical protein [Erysipelothrix anatis]|uniref:hypothetical protein n=1 Tax=Erysipelothrix anatis TaxID=2683713 RepID=UPI00135B65BE|nr:hypothetical protein [Erysipelothrix anatis]